MKIIVKKLLLSCALLMFGASQLSALSVTEYIERVEDGRIPMYGRNRLVLSGAGLTSLEGLDHILQQKPQIRQLYLDNNNLTVVPNNIFDHAQNLQTLNLSNNQISRLPQTLFVNLPNLTHLDLSNNPFHPEFISTFITMVQNMPNLQVLNGETVDEALRKLLPPTLKNITLKYIMENLQPEEFEKVAETIPTAFDLLPLSQAQRQEILNRVAAKRAAQQTAQS